MRRIYNIVRKSWRTSLTAIFVLTVFTMPASKGMLGKLFTIYAASGNNNGNNNGNNHGNNHASHSANSANQSTFGSPHANPTASPINHGDSCSTGRRHSRPHHGHRGHPHYRPNGR